MPNELVGHEAQQGHSSKVRDLLTCNQGNYDLADRRPHRVLRGHVRALCFIGFMGEWQWRRSIFITLFSSLKRTRSWCESLKCVCVSMCTLRCSQELGPKLLKQDHGNIENKICLSFGLESIALGFPGKWLDVFSRLSPSSLKIIYIHHYWQLRRSSFWTVLFLWLTDLHFAHYFQESAHLLYLPVAIWAFQLMRSFQI